MPCFHCRFIFDTDCFLISLAAKICLRRFAVVSRLLLAASRCLPLRLLRQPPRARRLFLPSDALFSMPLLFAAMPSAFAALICLSSCQALIGLMPLMLPPATLRFRFDFFTFDGAIHAAAVAGEIDEAVCAACGVQCVQAGVWRMV